MALLRHIIDAANITNKNNAKEEGTQTASAESAVGSEKTTWLSY
jgi:hypothetical protein